MIALITVRGCVLLLSITRYEAITIIVLIIVRDCSLLSPISMYEVIYYNRPFSHCFCACVYRSRDALFLDNRRDFT